MMDSWIMIGLVTTVALVPSSSPTSFQSIREVATAEAAYRAALARAGLAAQVFQYPRGSLSVGTPVVNADGFIADTPEVAAAKAAHFAVKAQVEARVRGNAVVDHEKSFSLPPNLSTGFIWTDKYTGPIAFPVVTPNGYLEDTPEVLAAKLAHLRAHALKTQKHRVFFTDND